MSHLAMYCLGCYYDLRGQRTLRCPECGRPFDPARPGTFSRLSRPTPVRDWMGALAKTLEEVFSDRDPNDQLRRLRSRTSSLATEIAWLRTTNDILRMHLDLVLNILIERQLMDPSELEALRAEIDRAVNPAGLVVEEDVAAEADAQAEPVSTELLELEEAARRAAPAPHGQPNRQ